MLAATDGIAGGGRSVGKSAPIHLVTLGMINRADELFESFCLKHGRPAHFVKITCVMKLEELAQMLKIEKLDGVVLNCPPNVCVSAIELLLPLVKLQPLPIVVNAAFKGVLPVTHGISFCDPDQQLPPFMWRAVMKSRNQTKRGSDAERVTPLI